MSFGLKERDIDNILTALMHIPEIEEALIFWFTCNGEL